MGIPSNKNDMQGIIIQARLGSSRLPNKVILPFYNGKGILELLATRLIKEFPDLKTVIATSVNENDNRIEDICYRMGIDCYRGSENNVLDRYIQAAQYFGINKIIRICSDNPFLNMKGLQQLVDRAALSNADYISFRTSNKPTIQTHYGLWAEIVKTKALLKVANLTNNMFYLEHVTNYIYTHPDLFKIEMIPISNNVKTNEFIRLTMDTKDDYNLLKHIYSKLPDFNSTVDELIKFILKNPSWVEKMQKQIELNEK